MMKQEDGEIRIDVDAILEDARSQVSNAVTHFWTTRTTQAARQRESGVSDQGARCAVTGGRQMDGFISIIAGILTSAGVDSSCIYCSQCLELPGYFRPTKQWDILVVKDHQLIAAIEAKSQVGPSFGNNFNNRTEEAMGSAIDLWTAFREGAFNSSVTPWLGYLFLLEDSDKSRSPVSNKEPHFSVFPEFKNASYMQRYEWFCRKLVREKMYSAASFMVSAQSTGLDGVYSEPASDLSFDVFARSLFAHALSFGR